MATKREIDVSKALKTKPMSLAGLMARYHASRTTILNRLDTIKGLTRTKRLNGKVGRPVWVYGVK